MTQVNKYLTFLFYKFWKLTFESRNLCEILQHNYFNNVYEKLKCRSSVEVFAKISDFRIPISLYKNIVKYQRFAPLDCKDSVIRKFQQKLNSFIT